MRLVVERQHAVDGKGRSYRCRVAPAPWGTSQVGAQSVLELGSGRDTIFFKRLLNAGLVAAFDCQNNDGNVSGGNAGQAPCLANRAGREALQHGDCLGP